MRKFDREMVAHRDVYEAKDDVSVKSALLGLAVLIWWILTGAVAVLVVCDFLTDKIELQYAVICILADVGAWFLGSAVLATLSEKC